MGSWRVKLKFATVKDRMHGTKELKPMFPSIFNVHHSHRTSFIRLGYVVSVAFNSRMWCPSKLTLLNMHKLASYISCSINYRS